MFRERLNPYRRKIAFSSTAIVLLIALLVILRPGHQSLLLTFIDVGQGDSAIVRTPGGRTVLIDGGGNPGNPDSDVIGPRVVEPLLRRYGISRIDLVVLTHPHDDHLKGLLAILKDFKVDEVLDPGIPHRSHGYREFLLDVREKHISYHRAVRGQVINFGDGVTASVLNPRRPMLEGTADDTNNNSIVLQFRYGHWKALFTGDAGAEAEEDMLSSGKDVRSDVLKVGHHGSATSTSDLWLDAVHPRVAVISVGRRNAFGHPSVLTMDRLRKHGVRIYRTDRDGAVCVTIDRNKDNVGISIDRQSD